MNFCQQPSVLPRTVQLAGPQGRTSSVSFQLFPFCFFLFVSVNCAFSGFSFNLFRRVTNPLPVRGCDTTAPSLVLWKVCNCLVNLAGRMNTHGLFYKLTVLQITYLINFNQNFSVNAN